MMNVLRNLFRKKKEFKEYDFELVEFTLPEIGVVQYARWLHPGDDGNEVNQEKVNFFRQYIKRGDFVIDIGANEGAVTVPMAIAAGKEGLTLAFEVNPHVFKVLNKNASLNKNITRIEPMNFAITAQDGEFTFGSGDPSYGNGGIVGFTHNEPRNIRYTFQVKGMNLEKYLGENHSGRLNQFKLIKIDTEGYDKEIIKSIPKLLNTYKPVIITECFGPLREEEKREHFQQLEALGYSMFRIIDFKGSTPEPISIRDMTGKNTFDILALPG